MGEMDWRLNLLSFLSRILRTMGNQWVYFLIKKVLINKHYGGGLNFPYRPLELHIKSNKSPDADTHVSQNLVYAKK